MEVDYKILTPEYTAKYLENHIKEQEEKDLRIEAEEVGTKAAEAAYGKAYEAATASFLSAKEQESKEGSDTEDEEDEADESLFSESRGKDDPNESNLRDKKRSGNDTRSKTNGEDTPDKTTDQETVSKPVELITVASSISDGTKGTGPAGKSGSPKEKIPRKKNGSVRQSPKDKDKSRNAGTGLKYRYRDKSTYSVSDLQIIAMNDANFQPFDENVVHLFKNKMNRGDKKVLSTITFKPRTISQ